MPLEITCEPGSILCIVLRILAEVDLVINLLQPLRELSPINLLQVQVLNLAVEPADGIEQQIMLVSVDFETQ